MARRITTASKEMSGLYYAREARGMSRSELIRRSGVSKQQLSRLEGGHIRMRLDHLKPFAPHLGYTPEQILLWGKLPGTGTSPGAASDRAGLSRILGQVPELDARAARGGGRSGGREVRKDGRYADPVKPEGWLFPPTFVREQLHSTPDQLVVLDIVGDSMAPTVTSGDRVVVDTGRKTPSPDGLYAIRDALEGIVVKRLQLRRSARPPRVKIISDNEVHAAEEIALSELEVVGKVVCCLKVC
jgi:transcriptional regulator with XRE-family HTH domain